MRILVTGGTGFVGKHVCANFQHAGHEVVHYDLNPQAFPPGDSGVAGDIRDPHRIRHALQTLQPDACLHLAGVAFVPLSWDRPRDVFDINLNGTVHLLDAFRDLAPHAPIVVVTSSLIYGPVSTPGHAFDESDPPHPDTPYAVSKLAADTTARLYARRYGMNIVTARPCNHTGPGQSESFVVPSFARQLLDIRLGRQDPVLNVGNLDSIREFLDVRDVARAYRLLLEQGNPGKAYNIASGNHLPIRDILGRLMAITGVNPRINVDPQRFRPTDRQPALSTRAIREDTGWAPAIPIDQTLADIVQTLAG